VGGKFIDTGGFGVTCINNRKYIYVVDI